MSFCNIFSKHQNIIIMNNVNIHINDRVKTFIQSYECRCLYLFFYSLNYNSIEFNFFIFKTWIKKHFHALWFRFERIFENFLRYVIERNKCDRFAIKHFKHNAQKEYIFENDIHAMNERLAKIRKKFDLN